MSLKPQSHKTFDLWFYIIKNSPYVPDLFTSLYISACELKLLRYCILESEKNWNLLFGNHNSLKSYTAVIKTKNESSVATALNFGLVDDTSKFYVVSFTLLRLHGVHYTDFTLSNAKQRNRFICKFTGNLQKFITVISSRTLPLKFAKDVYRNTANASARSDWIFYYWSRNWPALKAPLLSAIKSLLIVSKISYLSLPYKELARVRT
jgi:hypothetical protein